MLFFSDISDLLSNVYRLAAGPFFVFSSIRINEIFGPKFRFDLAVFLGKAGFRRAKTGFGC